MVCLFWYLFLSCPLEMGTREGTSPPQSFPTAPHPLGQGEVIRLGLSRYLALSPTPPNLHIHPSQQAFRTVIALRLSGGMISVKACVRPAETQSQLSLCRLYFNFNSPILQIGKLRLTEVSMVQLHDLSQTPMKLEKTLESPLDCKEIQPVHPRGDQS